MPRSPQAVPKCSELLGEVQATEGRRGLGEGWARAVRTTKNVQSQGRAVSLARHCTELHDRAPRCTTELAHGTRKVT